MSYHHGFILHVNPWYHLWDKQVVANNFNIRMPWLSDCPFLLIVVGMLGIIPYCSFEENSQKILSVLHHIPFKLFHNDCFKIAVSFLVFNFCCCFVNYSIELINHMRNDSLRFCPHFRGRGRFALGCLSRCHCHAVTVSRFPVVCTIPKIDITVEGVGYFSSYIPERRSNYNLSDLSSMRKSSFVCKDRTNENVASGCVNEPTRPRQSSTDDADAIVRLHRKPNCSEYQRMGNLHERTWNIIFSIFSKVICFVRFSSVCRPLEWL